MIYHPPLSPANRANTSWVFIVFDTDGEVGHKHDLWAACACKLGLPVG
jgi:hypothetical protein